MTKVLGLDIQFPTFRGTLIDVGLRTTRILKYVEINIHDPTSNISSNEQNIASTLLSKLPYNPDHIITSIDGSNLSMRKIYLPPKISSRKIPHILNFEITDKIPFDTINTIIDYQNVNNSKESLAILIAASTHQNIQNFLRQLSTWGFEPHIITTSASNLDNLSILIPQLNDPYPQLLIDFRVSNTDLCIIRKGQCVFARTISENYRSNNLEQEQNLISSIKRSIKNYRFQGGSSIKEIFVCGRKKEEGIEIKEQLETTLQIRTSILDLPKTKDSNPTDIHCFTLSTALALYHKAKKKKINFRKGQFLSLHSKRNITKNLHIFSISIFLIAISYTCSLTGRYFSLHSKNKNLRHQLSTTTQQLFNKATQDPEKSLKFLEKLSIKEPLPPSSAFDILHGLSLSIPSTIKHNLSQLIIELSNESKEGNLKMRGRIAKISDRDIITKNMEQIQCLQKILPGSTSFKSELELTYQLTANIKCSGTTSKNKSNE